MKIIDRYLLRTFLVPFFYCLTAFMMMYVIFDLFDNLNDFVDGKTPLMLVVKYYLILFPSVMIRIVPISLLLAVLYSLSSLTKNNELTAMRASGVSIIRLMIPFLSVGLFFTLVVGVVHETIGPRAAYWCYNFVREQKKSDPAAVYVKQDLAIKNQVTRRIWLVGEFDIRDYRMKQIEVIQQREDTSDAKKIRAKDAQWLDGRWWFRDLVEQVYDQDGNPMGPPRFALTEEMEELTEEPSLFLNEFKDPEFLSSLELMDYLKTHKHRERPALARIEADLHSRLAMPWTCFIVTLLGIPFGSQTGRKGAFLGVALSIGLFFGYYVLVNVGLGVAKSMLVPAVVGGWLPNIIFLAIGLVMVYRMR
jgi:lipopolysaccharide export system permease protein